MNDRFKFLAGLAELFEARFMRPLWQRYPACDSDSFDALALFLDGYVLYRMSKALDDLGYAKALLNEHIEAVHQEVLVWEQKQEL